ncbi:MAG: alpha/beta hydrolase [Fuerstiella sp.]
MNLKPSMKRVGEISLRVVESESDQPNLVLLHGVTRRWQTFLPILCPLALRHRLLLVDFRGHGESDRATDGYRVTDYVDDICRLIQQHVSGPVSLYGHSLGAMTVAGVASRLGDRVAAVIMEDPPLETMGNRISRTPLLSYFRGLSQFAGDDRNVAEIAAALGDLSFQDPVSGDCFRVGDTRDAAQLRFGAASLRLLDPSVFEPILNSQWLTGFDVDQVFGTLSCPSLLLQADYSSGGMLTEQDAEHVASLNSQIARVPLRGVGHGIHWTATQDLLNVVLPFLESARGGN